MKRAIASLFSAMSSKGTSHNSGFARILSSQMKSAGLDHDVLWTDQGGADVDWNEYDEIYLYHGLDLNGKLSLNLFGGTCEANRDKLVKLAFYQGKLIPLHYEMPDYAALAVRDWAVAPNFWKDQMAKRLKKVARPWVYEDDNLTIGDSHAPSVWQSKHSLEVWSGVTMHGFVHSRTVDDCTRWAQNRRDVTLYFGNIDVRHHLCRQDQPAFVVTDLVRAYEERVAALQQTFGWKSVELTELSPIEDESRQIPGPGCYKGKPFHGSREERNVLRMMCNHELHMAATRRRKQGWSFYRHPIDWVQPDGKMDQNYMERPRSVHIAPQHYRAAAHLFQ